jgi:hypothetical protein
MFRPNTFCMVSRRSLVADLYGSYTFTAPQQTACAVVTYDLSTHKTSVRADSSASGGRAEHLAGVARFLFPKNVVISRGDRVTKDNFLLEVIEVHPRRSVLGPIDHIEVDMRPYTEA